MCNICSVAYLQSLRPSSCAFEVVLFGSRDLEKTVLCRFSYCCLRSLATTEWPSASGVHAALATNISSVFSFLIASRVNLYIFEDVLGEMPTFGTPGGVLTRAKCAPRAFFRDVCVLLSK